MNRIFGRPISLSDPLIPFRRDEEAWGFAPRAGRACRLVYDDHALPAMLLRVIGGGLPHDDEHAASRVGCPGDEPFSAIDDVIIPRPRDARAMFVASEDATSYSVIAKADRIVRSSSGFIHCSFKAGEPPTWSSSMFPVSPGEQLNTSDAHSTWPLISAQGAYSRLVMRVPVAPSGRFGMNMFQRPRALASAFNSSRNGGGKMPSCSVIRVQSFSRGWMNAHEGCDLRLDAFGRLGEFKIHDDLSIWVCQGYARPCSAGAGPRQRSQACWP
jgi:hypothetical protein